MYDPDKTGSPEERRHIVGVGTFTASPLAKQLVNEVLDANRLSYGPMTQRFESEFARLHGCRFGIMSNSGTSALQLALQAMKELHGWADGDEVLVPAVTFVATANIVLHNRMVPVLVDVDPLYYSLDPAQMEKATHRPHQGGGRGASVRPAIGHGPDHRRRPQIFAARHRGQLRNHVRRL